MRATRRAKHLGGFCMRFASYRSRDNPFLWSRKGPQNILGMGAICLGAIFFNSSLFLHLHFSSTCMWWRVAPHIYRSASSHAEHIILCAPCVIIKCDVRLTSRAHTSMQELRYVADVVVVCALNYCNDAKATIHSTKIYNFNQSGAFGRRRQRRCCAHSWIKCDLY